MPPPNPRQHGSDRSGGNPFWREVHDHPIALLDVRSWEEAQRGGHLTADHVFLRLSDICEHHFGNGSEAGIGPDGFVTALIADAWPVPRTGIKVRIWPNDHPPPHVHIEFPGTRHDLSLLIATGEVYRGTEPPGARKGLRHVRDLLAEQRDVLLARWDILSARA